MVKYSISYFQVIGINERTSQNHDNLLKMEYASEPTIFAPFLFVHLLGIKYILKYKPKTFFFKQIFLPSMHFNVKKTS